MAYLEDWSLLDREHSSSLSGAIEALKASTLRLPIVGGARVCFVRFQMLVVTKSNYIVTLAKTINFIVQSG